MPEAVGSDQLEARVAAIRKRIPAYGEVAAWVGRLLALTMDEAARVEPPTLEIPAQRLGAEFAAGRSLLDTDGLPLDHQAARALLARLLKQVEARKDGRAQAASLRRLLTEDSPRLKELFQAVMSNDRPAQEKAAAELDVDPQVQNMLLHLALRPSLLAAAQAALAQADLAQWSAGHCPVCGSAPRLAELAGEGGHRTLRCSLCETAWDYRRLQCPFCENQDSDNLVVLLPEGEEGYRVDVCRHCGQYLKTLDLRSLAGPVIPLLDDLVTWHLDLVAQKYLAEQEAPSQAS